MKRIIIAAAAALAFSSAAIAQVQAQTQTPVTVTKPHGAILPTTPTGVLLKAGAGKLFHVTCGSTQAAVSVLKVYDVSTAPTCGSGTPFFRLVCPGATAGGNAAADLPLGKAFANGLGYCVTGAMADADTTALTANSVSVSMDYQ